MRFRTLCAAALISGLAASPLAVAAGATWDMTIVWPTGNLHTRAATEFAERVASATNGDLTIVVHAGGALGHKGPEILRTIQRGIVPIGELSLLQQVGDEPFLGIETVPFLVSSLDELKVLHKYARPEFEKIFERRDQVLLYLIPWPSQNIFTKVKAESSKDLENIKIRTQGKEITNFMSRLGMTPVQLPWGDVVPALATGRIEAVATSSPSAIDGKFWEFMKYVHRTNHLWATNGLSVNRAAFDKLSDDQKGKLTQIAKEIEAKYWKLSFEEDSKNLKLLEEKGMVLVQPSPEMKRAMQDIARPMWDEFIKNVGGPSERVIVDFRKHTDK